MAKLPASHDVVHHTQKTHMSLDPRLEPPKGQGVKELYYGREGMSAARTAYQMAMKLETIELASTTMCLGLGGFVVGLVPLGPHTP